MGKASRPVTPGSHPFDPCNPLLATAESRLDTAVMQLPDGSRAGAVTIRTATATVTVMLAAPDLKDWSTAIAALYTLVTAPVLAKPADGEIYAIGRSRTDRRDRA